MARKDGLTLVSVFDLQEFNGVIQLFHCVSNALSHCYLFFLLIRHTCLITGIQLRKFLSTILRRMNLPLSSLKA